MRFASTLPALLAGGGIDTRIDPTALNFYMSFHAVVPAPYTILKGVRKLPPGHTLTVHPDGRKVIDRYWELAFTPSRADRTRSTEEWQEEVLAALRKAVERRLVADVPTGVLLSGGLDFEPHHGPRPRDRRRPGAHLLDRLRGRGRRGRQRVPLFRRHRQAFRDRSRAHRGQDRQSGAAAQRLHRRHVRAHGQPRQCRVLPAVRGSRAPREGRAVGPGRRRGVRRLSLVSADAGQQRPGRRLCAQLLRPRLRRLCGAGGAGAARRRRRARVRHGAFRGGPGRPADRQGAAHRPDRDAARRSGEAPGQYEHGARPGGARAVHRPRVGRAGGARAGRAQDQGRRQICPEGSGAARHPGRRHRPAQGLFPGAGAQAHRRPGARLCARHIVGAGGARARPVQPRRGRPVPRRAQPTTSRRCAARCCGKWRCSSPGCRPTTSEARHDRRPQHAHPASHPPQPPADPDQLGVGTRRRWTARRCRRTWSRNAAGAG